MHGLKLQSGAPPRSRRTPGRTRLSRSTVVVLTVGLTAALGLAALKCAESESSPAPPETGTVHLRPADGGPNFYARFPNSLPSDPRYFPVGVWLESVISKADVAIDKAAGLNLYVGLTSDSRLPLIAANGMKVIAQQEEWLGRANARGSEAIGGWLLTDEIDMQIDPREGFARLQAIRSRMPADDGRLHYNNFGKGVTFWNTDAEAAEYVNRFQDVVSADNYWFTDNDICGSSEGGTLLADARRLGAMRCRRAANYGRTVDRVRTLMRPAGDRPVWSFVEVGHPFSGAGSRSIKPAEVSAAVWSGLIHGARGIVYFNHSFGGPAPTQHALREPAYRGVRKAVARTNARIRGLAPVLNAPFVDGFVRTGPAVDTMAKYYRDQYYVFAGSRVVDPGRVRFRVRCTGDSTLTVVGENRSLTMSRGSFADSFADGNSVHIYRIKDGSSCALPAP
jgi:hypothetical protein